MSSRWVLSSLVLAACGASAAQKPAPAPAPVPPAAPSPAAVAEAPKPPAPPPALPALPEAPPPAGSVAQRPHVAKALAYLPERTKLVLGIDVPRLAHTPLGDKLRGSFAGPDIPAPCQKLTAGQFGNLVFGAIGDGGMVAALDGKLDERSLRPCLDAAAKAKGGKLETKAIQGRKAYYISGSAQDNGWGTWPRGGGMLLASGEAPLTEALDPKAKKLGSELAKLVAKVDQSHMVWAAAIVPADALAGLGLAGGALTGPVAMRFTLDTTTETEVDMVVELATADDATRAATALRQLVDILRKATDTAPFVRDVRLGVYDRALHVIAKLDAAATQKLMTAINAK